MTIKEAIDICDRMRPNDFSYFEKEMWVRELEARIEEEIILTHEKGMEMVRMHAEDGILYAGTPHDSMYLSFLLANIDRANGENARYNESAATFNAQYTAYSAWYNRTHMPLAVRVDVRENR